MFLRWHLFLLLLVVIFCDFRNIEGYSTSNYGGNNHHLTKRLYLPPNENHHRLNILNNVNYNSVSTETGRTEVVIFKAPLIKTIVCVTYIDTQGVSHVVKYYEEPEVPERPPVATQGFVSGGFGGFAAPAPGIRSDLLASLIG